MDTLMSGGAAVRARTRPGTCDPMVGLGVSLDHAMHAVPTAPSPSSACSGCGACIGQRPRADLHVYLSSLGPEPAL